MSFSGLVIGGPQAGAFVTAETERYRVSVTSPVPNYYAPEVEPRSIEIEHFEYVHVVGLRGLMRLDFWMPFKYYKDPIEGALWCFRQLVAGYKELHQ